MFHNFWECFYNADKDDDDDDMMMKIRNYDYKDDDDDGDDAEDENHDWDEDGINFTSCWHNWVSLFCPRTFICYYITGRPVYETDRSFINSLFFF